MLSMDSATSRSSDLSRLSLLKRKRGDWALDMGVVDGPNVTDLPVLENNVEVICLSQVTRRLSDPLVGERDFVIVDPIASCSRQWTGTRLTGFITGLQNEMDQQAANLLQPTGLQQLLGDDAMWVVVFEAYKLLEEDLTILMQSILRMKANAKTIKHLRKFVKATAEIQS